MNEAFLPEIDITSYTTEVAGLDAKALSFFRRVYAVLTPDNIEQAFVYLQQTVGLYETTFDVTRLPSVEDVFSILDSGAFSIIASNEQLSKLRDHNNIDLNRIVLSVHIDTNQQLREAVDFATTSIHLSGNLDVSFLQKHLASRNPSERTILVFLPTPTKQSALELSKGPATIVLPATVLTVDPSAHLDLISAAELFLAKATTDRPDKLFTTLVTNERGIALGLVYSSKESVLESLRTGRGVYQSRKRGLWYKGESSGDTQELVSLGFDCDSDCLRFVVRQQGRGFCHLATATCFGPYRGLSKLQQTLQGRKESAPDGSYTARLFREPPLLQSKILEEAKELCEATEKSHIAFEAADLLYFALTKCVSAGVSLEDVERNLDAKSVKIKRRKGDAKQPIINGESKAPATSQIKMTRIVTCEARPETIQEALQRPSQRSIEETIAKIKPIMERVRKNGDAALISYTHHFDKAVSLKDTVIRAPYPEKLMELPQETIDAIDVSFENIRKFHLAQREEKPLEVETMPGVICSRFARPIERVGLYVPGGTAVLPSTALMLGVPAMVAGCKTIVLASPPRKDGSITPEIVYVAHKVGAESIVLAGGAQAVAALAYGTESVSKVDKILGPGNQFVTAAKMIVSNDTSAGVSIDMPAGPSEVLVVADKTSNPAFVASDLLSQAEHGIDSQVILIAVDMSEEEITAVEDELHLQASALPRVDIVRGAIDHSVTLVVKTIEEAINLSNQYAPEHLILQCNDPERVIKLVENAGSVFIGKWTPESVGDYSAGVNHSLPTYGYARQYSGVNLGSYIKHITSSKLTAQGLRNVGGAVMQLAKVEELEAHRRAVSIRLAYIDRHGNA